MGFSHLICYWGLRFNMRICLLDNFPFFTLSVTSLPLVILRSLRRQPWPQTMFKLSIVYIIITCIILVHNCVIDLLFMGFWDHLVASVLHLHSCPGVYSFHRSNERSAWMLTGKCMIKARGKVFYCLLKDFRVL
ncbi:hypothetical protein BDV36DRAFT_104315 [Aspergillus pseudocaelatus]|uniref:Uncharacterized protein n=1 Tax=Aspergillus pseudocaelatus TaxID=1825620 RepID=A0ABQ6W1A9_9EURO|nr:hypothetical protein BDV36DRAFT_104315 [Aspergillus pseudocaelatus]